MKNQKHPLSSPHNFSERSLLRYYLLVDISNSYTKIVRTDGVTLYEVTRWSTGNLQAKELVDFETQGGGDLQGVMLCSVVPHKTEEVQKAFARVPILQVSAKMDLGIGIEYPHPQEVGADRLANAVACYHLIGAPAIVVDFGTAVTFDVLSKEGNYLGGVIAPGLSAMTTYLHEKTALLPYIELAEPTQVVGKSTYEAMLSGAIYGYRGLIREIIAQIKAEKFEKQSVHLVATGGDAELLGKGLPLFDHIDPLLTLHGLRLLAQKNFSSLPQ